MNRNIRTPEALLLAAALVMLLVAWLAPPLAQSPHYHDFADQRTWLGIPCAMDVLSNLPFALFGLAGLLHLRGLQLSVLSRTQYGLAALFFSGLLLTAICSSIYHWRPDDAGLALDRAGMAVAFAGLLGLGVAGRISERAGLLTAMAVLLFGPLGVWVWAQSGNVLPWALLQFGGMGLLLVLAWMRPLYGALEVRWGLLILIYALAKLLELGDRQVFDISSGLISGHTLKHLVAALAAWPVLRALQLFRQNRPTADEFATTRQSL